MKKRGKVYVRKKLAGIIEQGDGEFKFTYEPSYLRSKAEPVSLRLPLREEPYIEKTMIPYFDGLIPEGWLLNIAQDNWKIDRTDRMLLLLTLCRDCIGAVTVEDDSAEE